MADLDSVEISKLRSTSNHPCDVHVNHFDEVLVADIMRNVTCKPYYIQEQNYSNIQNCTELEKIKDLNTYLGIENTFSLFKSFHRKPCANFAMTFKQKIFEV